MPKRNTHDYDSSFEGDSFVPSRNSCASTSSQFKNKYRDPLLQPKKASRPLNALPSREVLNDLSCSEIGRTLRFHMKSMSAYDRHKMLIDQYVLYHPDGEMHLKRDSSKDKRDIDVVREHHKFLWKDSDTVDTWEKQLAKKYYDKLFKEYCICDLSRYKENKIGMRWRTETEVKSGRGQFSCGNKRCQYNVELKTWEMNFAYNENGEKKNALIKLRLCEPCSLMLNYCSKRKEITKKMKKRKKQDQYKLKYSSASSSSEVLSDGDKEKDSNESDKKEAEESNEEDIWKAPAKILDEKSREEEFEEYLEDLFL